MQYLGLGNDGNIIPNAVISDAQTSFVGIKSIEICHIISIQFITRSIVGAFTGNWAVEVSNNYAPAAGDSNFGQRPNAGDWIAVDTQFSPAVTLAVSTATIQMCQSPASGSAWRHIRITLTRTSGAGTGITADVWLCGKGA